MDLTSDKAPPARVQPRGLRAGALLWEFRDMNLEAEGLVIFLDPTVTLTVSYEYLCCHPIGDRLRPPT
jgi:hypothetical protein